MRSSWRFRAGQARVIASDDVHRARVERILDQLNQSRSGHFKWTESLQATTQSSCHLLVEDDAHEWVLKVFDARYLQNTPASFRQEVDTLDRFSSALAGSNIEVTCPRPEAVFEEDMAYLMPYFPGADLSLVNICYLRANSSSIIARLIAAMHLFYEQIGPMYGDFHLKNLLLNESGGLCLIDPTHPNPIIQKYGLPTFQRGVADLSYWLLTTNVASVRPWEFGFRRLFPNLGFTASLLDTWAAEMTETNRESYLHSVFEVSDRMLRDTLKSSTTRSSLLYIAAKAPATSLRLNWTRHLLAHAG